MSNVAILGLGAMGSRMAARLLAAGHSLTIWNRTPNQAQPLIAGGAKQAATPREAAADADFIIAMLRDDEASRDVWLDAKTGALAGLKEDAIAIESSTLSHQWTLALAAGFDEQGSHFLDAPVLGSRPQADAGQLIHLVGGDHAVFEKAAPVLAKMGAAQHWCGETGCGTAMKLVINALFATQVAALAELRPLLRETGVDTTRAAEILGATPVLSPVAKGALALMNTQAFAPLFPVELAEKDLRYALAVETDRDDAMPLTASVRDVLREAMDRGFGVDNLTGIYRLYE